MNTTSYYTNSGERRRAHLRLAEGHLTADETAALLTNPRFDWVINRYLTAPTAAQWAQIGRGSGVVCR